MSWTAYQVTFQMDSPLHSGVAKVGNIQRTRLYATGRMLWGAMTERLTRLMDGHDYVDMGQKVARHFRSSYFFPCFDKVGVTALLPQVGERDMHYGFSSVDSLLPAGVVERCLLTSYASTAIDAGRGTAENGSLHEIELVSHRAMGGIKLIELPKHLKQPLEAGDQVYLTGYFFLDEAAPPEIGNNWQVALSQLQIGGERGYGYGRLTFKGEPTPTIAMFGYELDPSGVDPLVRLKAGDAVLAHVAYCPNGEGTINGPMEPFLGRLTTPDGRFGVKLDDAIIAWAPGSRIRNSNYCTLSISNYGVWKFAK